MESQRQAEWHCSNHWKEGLTPEEIANKTGQPLFRVRSGLRELRTAGLVKEETNKYNLTEKGKTAIQ